MRAIRGGYSLPFKNLARAIVLPSAFNDKRHWTTNLQNPAAVVSYFPYFDPAISLKYVHPAGEEENIEPEADPALIFKALGDSTRYAIASLLANTPSSSAVLAKRLQLSAATVSHHVHVLREAGLLLEKPQGNTVLIELNRELLEHLSDLVIDRFFRSEPVDLKRTRTQ